MALEKVAKRATGGLRGGGGGAGGGGVRGAAGSGGAAAGAAPRRPAAGAGGAAVAPGEAKYPEAGSRLPCSLSLTLSTDSGVGDVEVAAPGALGREAMRAVSRAAYCRLVELRKEGLPLIEGLTSWVQATELHELAAAQCPPRAGPTGLVRAFVRFHHVQSLMKRWAKVALDRLVCPKELHAALGRRLGSGGCLAQSLRVHIF